MFLFRYNPLVYTCINIVGLIFHFYIQIFVGVNRTCHPVHTEMTSIDRCDDFGNISTINNTINTRKVECRCSDSE